MSDHTPRLAAQDLDAWNLGFAAGRAGKGVNPYFARTRGALSWSSGYIEGEAKREAGFLPPRLADKPIPGG
jgi:hypothetical protein